MIKPKAGRLEKQSKKLFEGNFKFLLKVLFIKHIQ